MESIFSPQKVNLGRQLELDVARGLAIVFMVLIHSFELFMEHPFPNTASTHIIRFLGSPLAAPVFMLLLGVGIVYSKRTSAAFLFNRGIMTLILAYALALSRDLIPSYVAYLIKGDEEILIDGFLEFLGVDILQFAGLTFLFFALVIKLKFEIWQIVSCVFVFSTFGAILGEKSTGNLGLDAFAGLFWGTWDRTWFPFFSWIFFPVAGYIFGHFLMHCKNKTEMYKRIFIVSSVSLVPLVILSYDYRIEFGAFGDLFLQQYYHQDLFGNIILTIFSLFWISLLYFIVTSLKNCSFHTLQRWSKNVNQIYVTHWIIYGILCQIIENTLSVLEIVVLAAVVLIVSDLIATQYLKFKSKGYSFRFVIGKS